MPSFVITRCARRATRIGGRLDHVEKAIAKRRDRHAQKQDLRTNGEDATFDIKRYTGWDVV